MGGVVYTNDQRFKILRPNTPTTPGWVLVLEQSKPHDSGVYECQINTEPKKSRAYVINVLGGSKFLQNNLIFARPFKVFPPLPDWKDEV